MDRNSLPLEKTFPQCQTRDLSQVQAGLARLQGASLLAMDMCQSIETSLQQLHQLVLELQSQERLR